MWTLFGPLKPFLMPPMSLFLLGLAGWLAGKIRPLLGRVLMGTAAMSLYLLSTPLVGSTLLRTLETDPPIAADGPVQDAGAIVVLAGDFDSWAPEYGGYTVGALSMERLRYGAQLHRVTGKPLLTTGGSVRRVPMPLGQIMEDVLTNEFQVPVRWVEGASRNTFENALFSARILRAAGIDRVYLVTHAWHMPRAKWAFQAARVEVVAAPTGFTSAPTLQFNDFLASSRGLRKSAFAVHEWISRPWYHLAYGPPN